MIKFYSVLLVYAIFGVFGVQAWADETAGLRASDGSRAASRAQIMPWGVDLSGLQKNIKPGDDFYHYANGAWVRTAKIAPDSWSEGATRSVKRQTEALQRQLIDKLLQQSWPEDSDQAKFVRLYKSYEDRRRVNQLGVRPLEGFLDLVAKARKPEQIAGLLGSYQFGAGGLFETIIRLDPKGQQAYLASLEMADLLLGSPHNYLRDDPQVLLLRDTGAEILADMLRASGQRRSVNKRIEAVLRLETQIAALSPEPETLRNVSVDKVYKSLNDLEISAPAFPWAIYFKARGIGKPDRIHVRVWQGHAELADLFARTPVKVWQDYLRLRLLSVYGAFLSDKIAFKAEALKALHQGRALTQEDVSVRAGKLAMQIMPDIVGRAYLEQEAHTSQIAPVRQLAESIREAYRTRILAAAWLSEGTRTQAIEKLDAVEFVIGAPHNWNDYGEYEPNRKMLLANVYLARQRREVSALLRLLQPSDTPRGDISVLRSHIFFSPLQVGAYYLPRLNTIIIPANYIRPPFYDPGADMAVNFGALGSTIGHELGHAFDDQGSKYGPEGQLRDWWNPEDRARFKALGRQLANQFAAYEAVPGIKVNPDLTLGENLSDLVGLELAYEAYKKMRQLKSSDEVSLKQGTQRFFLGYAQKRRSVRRPEIALEFALNGPHSPPVHRVNGIVRNLDFWYGAYDVGPEHKLWLPPEERVKIW